MIETLLSTYRSVIVLNSPTLCKFPILDGAPIIAADGAEKWLMETDQIKSHDLFVVGDGDSSTSDRLIKFSDQDTTDFEKCIDFAKAKDLLPALVLGVNGGEIDHILGNIQTLLKCSRGPSLFFLDRFLDQYKIGIPLEKGTWQIDVEAGTTVSIIPFVSTVLTTSGLAWELHNQELVPDGLTSMRNRAESKRIELTVLEGKALFIADMNQNRLVNCRHLQG